MDRSNVPIAHCFSPCATKMPKLSTKQMCSWVSHPMSLTQRSMSEAIPPISKSTDATCRCRGESSTTCPRLPRQTRGQATVCGAFSNFRMPLRRTSDSSCTRGTFGQSLLRQNVRNRSMSLNCPMDITSTCCAGAHVTTNRKPLGEVQHGASDGQSKPCT